MYIFGLTYNKMNYIKNLLELKDQKRYQQKESPQLSGDFEVIYWPEQSEGKQETSLTLKIEIDQSSSQKNQQIQSVQNSNQIDNCSNQQQRSQTSCNKQYRIIEIDDIINEDEQNENSTKNNQGSASTIKIDQYYMIVDKQEIKGRLETQQEWQQFYQKIKSYESKNNFSMSCSKIKIEKLQIKLNLRELNSVLEIGCSQVKRRVQYWNRIAVSLSPVVFKHSQLCNKKDPQKLQKNVNKIINNLATQILDEMIEKDYRKIQTVQEELDIWKQLITKLLTLYGANDKQIGYSKGLEYIALGIIIAKPFPSFSSQQTNESEIQLQNHFKYLMFTKQLRNMYFPGTPKLYQQIQKLEKMIKIEVSQLYFKLTEINADLNKIFINYYKTFMLYKMKNPFVIRKLMQLLIIYGIDIVPVLITRVLNRNQQTLLGIKDEVSLLKYMAESLFVDYFGESNEIEVVEKFRQLFILDVFI